MIKMEQIDYNKPRVFVTTQHKIDHNIAVGIWIDLNDYDYEDDLIDFCNDFFRNEEEPALRFIEWKGVPLNLQSRLCPDFEKIWRFRDLDEDEQDIVLEYWDEVWSGCDIDVILDRYLFDCDADDMKRLGELLVDYEDLRSQHPDDFMWTYFNYEDYGWDARHDLYQTSHYVFNAN